MPLSAVDSERFIGLRRVWSGLCAEEEHLWMLQQTSLLGELTTVQGRIVAERRWSAGPSSLMNVLRLGRREVANCLVLRWLVDPLAHHRLGADMIEALSTRLGLPLPDPERSRARVEVSCPESRADLVITGRSWSLVFEAKVDAPEGATQADRLERDWPNADRLIFITRGGTGIPRTATEVNRWSSLSWQWFAETASALLNDSAAPDPLGSEAQHAAAEWVSAARRNLG